LTNELSPSEATSLRRKYRKIVGEVVEELKHRSGIIAILLSGSVARGGLHTVLR